MDWARTTARQDERHLSVWDFARLVLEVWRVCTQHLTWQVKSSLIYKITILLYHQVCLSYWCFCQYSAHSIFCGPFSPNNSRKTTIAHPLGRGMGVLREFEVWPKLYHRSCCVVCNIVLCYLSRVFHFYTKLLHLLTNSYLPLLKPGDGKQRTPLCF